MYCAKLVSLWPILVYVLGYQSNGGILRSSETWFRKLEVSSEPYS
jgi:hypothetical protein